jgi:hypothetical protein
VQLRDAHRANDTRDDQVFESAHKYAVALIDGCHGVAIVAAVVISHDAHMAIFRQALACKGLLS